MGLIAHLPQKPLHAPATAALATLVGALSTARAVNDDRLSREILKAAANDLKARLGPGSELTAALRVVRGEEK